MLPEFKSCSPSVNLCKIVTINMLLVLTNVNMLNGLKCVCNPNDCDLIRQSDCPGKGLTVWDPCKYVQESFFSPNLI